MFCSKKHKTSKCFGKKSTKPQNSMYYNSCPQLCGPQICVILFFLHISAGRRDIYGKKHSFFKYQ